MNRGGDGGRGLVYGGFRRLGGARLGLRWFSAARRGAARFMVVYGGGSGFAAARGAAAEDQEEYTAAICKDPPGWSMQVGNCGLVALA